MAVGHELCEGLDGLALLGGRLQSQRLADAVCQFVGNHIRLRNYEKMRKLPKKFGFSFALH